MTSAPPKLREARQLLLTHLDMHPGRVVGADLDPAEIGIVGDASHDGGYHQGKDRLRTHKGAVQDYSVIESPRDRAGLSDNASALDIGWFSVVVKDNRHTLRDLSIWLVAQCKADAPDTRDIREIIYSPDGVNVKRFDRLGKRTDGDLSHLSHTHISEFRDARGRHMVALLRRWLVHIGLIGGESDMDLKDVVYSAKQGNVAAVPPGARTVQAILAALDARTSMLTNANYIKQLVDALEKRMTVKLVALEADAKVDAATRAALVAEFRAAVDASIAAMNPKGS